MATQVSPGVVVTEIDKTLNLAQVALTDGGMAGSFRWGPVEQLRTIVSEEDLVKTFWKPDNTTAEYFFTAANFLAYSRSLRVVRVVSNTAYNASSNNAYTGQIKNSDVYEENTSDNATYYSNFGNWAAKYPGALGNGIRVEVCDSSAAYSGTPALKVLGLPGDSILYSQSTLASANLQTVLSVGDIVTLAGQKRQVVTVSGTNFTVNSAITSVVSNTTALSTITLNAVAAIDTSIDVVSGAAETLISNNDVLILANSTTKVVRTVNNVNSSVITFTTGVGVVGNAVTVQSASSFTREWRYARLFDGAPNTSPYVSARGGANDEMHVVVVDTVGTLSGVQNAVLEKYGFVSKASDAKAENGAANYYRDVINRTSPYIWMTDHIGADWGTASNNNFDVKNTLTTDTLSVGADGAAIGSAEILTGYDLFRPEEVEISFLLGGPASSGVATSLIANVIEPKKYVMGFFSPNKSAVVNNAGSEVDDILIYRNALPSTSFAVLDSGWKYQYDKYNDVYRWIPLNGDVAGCLVRTDAQAESWFSPAGVARGQIKNVVKLAFNPRQADRDDLYRSGVNPVVTFPGQGTILFGDKTLLSRPSAFDRINVRRLFVVLEKTVENSAKQQLFEQNDEFTRNAFLNLVEPFLRSVRARRGITDFYVVCDETNNPPDAVDRNEFRADIFVKPIRSINFIQLNFTAVRSDVAFTEVVTNLG